MSHLRGRRVARVHQELVDRNCGPPLLVWPRWLDEKSTNILVCSPFPNICILINSLRTFLDSSLLPDFSTRDLTCRDVP